MKILVAEGLQKVPASVLHTFGSPPDNAYGLANESFWDSFMADALPRLRDAGWAVEFDDDFRHFMLEVDAWDAELIESDNGWFDLDMGIIVDGERLPLAPLLASLFPQGFPLARPCLAASDCRRRSDRAKNDIQ
jgi:hypothetical protein